MSSSGVTVRDRIIHMIDFIDRSRAYTTGMSEEEFRLDRKTQDAVQRNLILLGEASKYVPRDLQGLYSFHPWRMLGDTRNRLVHDYSRIDVAVVWSIVTMHIPALRAALTGMLGGRPSVTDAASAAPPQVRIVWDVGTVPEWYGLMRQAPRSTLTQGFGYSAALMTTERWRPRLGVIELGDRPIGLVVMAEKRVAGLIRVARLHRGPLIRPEAAKPAVIAGAMKALRQAYPTGPLRWTAIIPELPAGPESEGILRWAGWRRDKGPGYRTIWLDLTRDEAALRAGLAQKWRNALNQAERAGLTVEADRDGSKLLPWLTEQYLADRAAKGYRGPSAPLLTRLRTAMHKDGDILVLRALLDGEPAAGVLMLGHGVAATYQVGWTGEAGRRARAHNLLLWRAALELKAQGRHWLDLGGVLPDQAPGVTAFKRGMGGEEVELAGVWR